MLISERRPTTVQDAVRNYLRETLGIDPVIRQSDGRNLPYFLQDAFELYELRIRDLPVLLAVNRRAKTPRVTAVRDQVNKLKSLAGRAVIYVTDALASYERKRLIEQKVPFIVPGNQLYLPDLGIDLREYFRQKAPATVHTLSPATQAMLIRALLHEPTQRIWQPAVIAVELHYTAMTVSRAVKELTTASIAALEQKGKVRWLYMARQPAETWELVKPLLRSPVKARHWISRTPKLHPEGQLPLAGAAALACHSQLADPTLPVYALDFSKWKTLTQGGLPDPLPEPHVGSFELQVWNYAPLAWRGSKTVDPLSLTLSLQSEADERVQSALEELQKKHYPW